MRLMILIFPLRKKDAEYVEQNGEGGKRLVLGNLGIWKAEDLFLGDAQGRQK